MGAENLQRPSFLGDNRNLLSIVSQVHGDGKSPEGDFLPRPRRPLLEINSKPYESNAPVLTSERKVKTSAAVLPDLLSRLPLSTRSFFIDQDVTKGLELTHPTFQEVDSYINNRLESFIIRANERNKELLDSKPYLRNFLPQRFKEDKPKKVTEEWLLQALSRHMVEDKMEFKDKQGVNYLPFDDIEPNDAAFKNKRFNWDSEMHLAAVLHSNLDGKMELAKNSLRNALYLFELPGMGYVPNAAARGLDDRTQPPRHTTMLRMVWDAMSAEERAKPENQEFFKQMWDFAKREYWEVFNAKDPQNPFSSDDPLHQSIKVDGGEMFTIYGSRDVVTYHIHSALGGAWDHSKQAYRREADHSRIDLEMYLYQYEQDFAWLHQGTPDQKEWEARMAKRKDRVLRYNYNPETGWFNHYDFKNRRQSSVDTVTGLFGLRLLDDPQQREKLINYFEERFMHAFGVGLTDPDTLPKMTPEKEQAIEAFESDPGMQLTLKELYNHEQWEGRRQFYIITKQIKDELEFAAESETNPELKQRFLRLADQIEKTTLVGLAQYFEKEKAETGEGTLPEKLHAETGEMADGAQYGDQKELVMPFGAFKLFMADQEAKAALDSVPGGIPTIVLPKQHELQGSGMRSGDVFVAE